MSEIHHHRHNLVDYEQDTHVASVQRLYETIYVFLQIYRLFFW